MRPIYLHGLGQAPAAWEPVLRRLGGPKEALCPDLAGLVAGGEATYPRLYRAFARLCDRQNAPLALCGLSLGGVLALQYAAERPERVGALALLAPQYRMPRRLLKMQNALFRLMPAALFRGTGFSRAQFIQLCGSMMELDLGEALPRVACPALVACGSRDRANRRACEELARLLPRGELHILEGAGHELNRDAPEALAALLGEFFGRAPEGREG